MESLPKPVLDPQRLVLCSCRKKNCPEITKRDERFVLSDPTELPGVELALDVDQAELLCDYLMNQLGWSRGGGQ